MIIQTHSLTKQYKAGVFAYDVNLAMDEGVYGLWVEWRWQNHPDWHPDWSHSANSWSGNRMWF